MKLFLNCDFSAFSELTLFNVALYFFQRNHWHVFVIFWVVDTHEFGFFDLPKGLVIVCENTGRLLPDHLDEMVGVDSSEFGEIFQLLFFDLLKGNFFVSIKEASIGFFRVKDE